MEPRPTRIWHVHPAATIPPRSKTAQESSESLGAQCAAGDRLRSVHARVPMTWSKARRGWRMRLPGRLGGLGGLGPAGEGQEQEDRAWIRADEVYPEYWQSTDCDVQSWMRQLPLPILLFAV